MPVPAIAGMLVADLTVSGLDAATFTRSTTKVFTDYESVLRTAAINEPAFEGGRRVENLSTYSDPSSLAQIAAKSSNITVESKTWGINGITYAIRYPANSGVTEWAYPAAVTAIIGRTYLFSAFVEMDDGSIPRLGTGLDKDFTIKVGDNSSGVTLGVPQRIIGNVYRVCGYRVCAATTSQYGLTRIISSQKGFTVSGIQVEYITGSAYQLPSEYIQTTGAAASRWFTTKPDGSPIYPTPKLLMEGQSTNYFLQSNTPASHTSPTCPAGTYTMWLTGTGSVAVAAGTAVGSGWGTATAAAPLTVTIATGGTVVFTVSGTVMIAQFEPLPVKSSYIPTTTAAVTRTADACSWPLSAELQAMLSIDKAWTTSLANQTTAGTNQCDMTDATALFKWSTLDAAPFANSGKMVIMRDASNRLAWGFLGAVSGTTGCLVYKDQARTIPGYVKEASVGAGTTFDVVADCKAEGTVVLDWIPSVDRALETTTRYLLRTGNDGGRLFYTNGGYIVTYDGSAGGAGKPWAIGEPIRLIIRYSSEKLEKRVSTIKNNMLDNATVSVFDGNYALVSILELANLYPYPTRFSGLKFFKRWLTDSELMRLQ
jgi:hypothetical protein